MADIQERIAGQFPEATFDTSDVLTVEIPDAKLHALAVSCAMSFISII